MIAVVPSALIATELPIKALPALSVTVTLFPCCAQTPLLRLKNQTAP